MLRTGDGSYRCPGSADAFRNGFRYRRTYFVIDRRWCHFWLLCNMRIFSLSGLTVLRARQLKPLNSWLLVLLIISVPIPMQDCLNSLGTYDQTPAEMADEIREYIHEGLVNIIGGCCGTTDEYIAVYSSL